MECHFWSPVAIGIFFQQKRKVLLEFDIAFIQEVDIKEPSEEQIQTTKRIKYDKDILLKIWMLIKSKALHSIFVYMNRGHIVCMQWVCVSMVDVPGQTKWGQDDDHEDQQKKALVHRYLVFTRSDIRQMIGECKNIVAQCIHKYIKTPSTWLIHNVKQRKVKSFDFTFTGTVGLISTNYTFHSS